MEKEFNDLVEFLDKHKIKYNISEHRKVHTSEEAAAVRGVELRSGVKALVFDVSNTHKDMIMVLVRGDHKVDPGRLKNVLNARNVKLADPKEVLKKTGCEIGSVHPFGNLFGLKVYMDRSILENKNVNFSAGMHTKSINMLASDIFASVKPEIVDVKN